MEKINQDKFYKMTIEEMKKVAEEVMKEKWKKSIRTNFIR